MSIKNLKITARRNNDCNPITDQNGKIIWDGKSQLIVLTTGDAFVTKHMFESMKKYVDQNIWQLKIK